MRPIESLITPSGVRCVDVSVIFGRRLSARLAVSALLVLLFDELLLLLEDFETLLVGSRAFSGVHFQFDFVEEFFGDAA